MEESLHEDAGIESSTGLPTPSEPSVEMDDAEDRDEGLITLFPIGDRKTLPFFFTSSGSKRKQESSAGLSDDPTSRCPALEVTEIDLTKSERAKKYLSLRAEEEARPKSCIERDFLLKRLAVLCPLAWS